MIVQLLHFYWITIINITFIVIIVISIIISFYYYIELFWKRTEVSYVEFPIFVSFCNHNLSLFV